MLIAQYRTGIHRSWGVHKNLKVGVGQHSNLELPTGSQKIKKC